MDNFQCSGIPEYHGPCCDTSPLCALAAAILGGQVLDTGMMFVGVDVTVLGYAAYGETRSVCVCVTCVMILCTLLAISNN